MAGSTTSEQLTRLRDWIVERHPERADVGIDTDLVEGVLFDSMEFVAFLVFVEDVRGAPIAADDVDTDNFRTLRTIEQRFFGR